MAKALKKIKIIFITSFLLIITIPAFFLVSCDKEKTIKLYNTDTKSIETLNLENYIEGVVAAEIGNSAPLEALKAQAVLARSFTMFFINNQKSKYEGADISTDITEAQAYNSSLVNENIKKAVKETKGIVMKYNNNYINTWFHANSGGKTTTAKDGLDLIGEEPKYLKVINTEENSDNCKNFSWTTTFSKSEILNTLRNMGISVSTITTFEKGELSDSGRCLTFKVGGKSFSSNTFRLNIGSTKLKSTLITNISVNEDSITFSGNGYGHGVGLSQEYSIILANKGKTYKEIINTFYQNISYSSIN